MGEDEPNDPRLADLAQRLDRVERLLGLRALPTPAPPVGVEAIRHAATPAAAPAVAAAAAAVPVEPGPLHEKGERLRGLVSPGAVPSAAATPPIAPPPAPPRGFRPATYVDAANISRGGPRGARAGLDIEKWIGGRWYAVVGAIIIVIGIGLFAKLAVARGWLALPVIVRCTLGALFGFVLIGAGAWVRRRFNNAWAGFGLFAAGLGSIYACTYAAYRLWEPLTNAPAVAFVLLACVAGLGIGIAIYSRLVAVGIVAQIGGYLTPFLFTDTAASPLVLPAYLLALLGVALILSAWRGGSFVAMRGVAWVATITIGGFFVLSNAGPHPFIGAAFLAVAWGAIHAELVWSAARRGLGTRATEGRNPGVDRALPLVSSLGTTAWSVLLAVIVFRAWGGLPDWLVPAGLAGAAAALGLTTAGHLRVLRDVPETDSERLGAGLLVQAGACVFAAIALGLSGELQVLAWMSVGVAAAVSGRWLRTRAFTAYGVAALAIGTLRLVLFDSWSGGLTVPDATVYGIILSRWMGLMAGAGVLWLALAWCSRAGFGAAFAAPIAAWTGMLLLAACFLHTRAELTSLCFVWCLLAVLVAALAELLIGLTLRWAALALWLIATFSWTVAYPFDTWGERAWGSFAHPGVIMMAILAACGVAIGWWAARREERPALLAGVAGVVLLLVFAGTSLEVDRVASVLAGDDRSRFAAVSIWWGLFACGLLAGGFYLRSPWTRWVGLGLLGVAGFKAVIFDLAGVSDVARIVSFIGLGLLMLGVAVVYSKVSASLEKTKDPDGTDGGDAA